jgi:hypothetical protein
VLDIDRVEEAMDVPGEPVDVRQRVAQSMAEKS